MVLDKTENCHLLFPKADKLVVAPMWGLSMSHPVTASTVKTPLDGEVGSPAGVKGHNTGQCGGRTEYCGRGNEYVHSVKFVRTTSNVHPVTYTSLPQWTEMASSWSGSQHFPGWVHKPLHGGGRRITTNFWVRLWTSRVGGVWSTPLYAPEHLPFRIASHTRQPS